MSKWAPACGVGGAILLAAALSPSVLAAAEDIAAVTVYIKCTADGQPASQGSGVLVSEDGLVLTAKHVVPNANYACEGGIGNSTVRRDLRPVPQETHLDGLLLRFTPSRGEKFAHVGYCPLTQQMIQQPITAAGFFLDSSDPLRRPSAQPRPRPGIIADVVPTHRGWIDTTVPVTPGMSGGPVLLDANGALVGIVASVVPDPSTGLPQYYGVLAAQEIATDLRLQLAPACGGSSSVPPEPDPWKEIVVAATATPPPSVSANNGGIAIGGNVSGSTVTVNQGQISDPEPNSQFMIFMISYNEDELRIDPYSFLRNQISPQESGKQFIRNVLTKLPKRPENEIVENAKIFRLRDGLLVNNNTSSILSEQNTGVIVIPNDVMSELFDNEPDYAYTRTLDILRKNKLL